MKRIHLVLFFIASFITLEGCKKDAPQPTVHDQLIGEWELTASYDGWSGSTTYPAGNGNRLIYTSNTYESYSNGQLVKRGVYQLVSDTSMLQNKTASRILLDEEIENPKISLRTFVDINNDTLIIALDAFDAGGVSYRRLKPF